VEPTYLLIWVALFGLHALLVMCLLLFFIRKQARYINFLRGQMQQPLEQQDRLPGLAGDGTVTPIFFGDITTPPPVRLTLDAQTAQRVPPQEEDGNLLEPHSVNPLPALPTTMPYAAPISRSNPTALIFCLDQSNSMQEAFGTQPEKSKASGVSDAINRLVQNLVLKCARAEGVQDFFHVGMISYGGRVQSAFGGPLAGKALVPISEIANNPLRIEVRTRKVEDGAGGLVDGEFKFPVWFDAKPTGRTPMCEALRKAKEDLQAFLGIQHNCYPPMVINITDGHPTDGDPRDAAKQLRGLASNDGNVLLFNAHLSDKQMRPIEFPNSESGLPDDYARLLFRMSSELPPKMLDAAKMAGLAVSPQSRGFVFNADLVAVIRFLDIGTRMAQGVQ
jgi:hypothetical protein